MRYDAISSLRIIEEGAFRAEVDVSVLRSPKVTVTMKPMCATEWREDGTAFDWENDIARDARCIRNKVDMFIETCRQMEKRRAGHAV